MPSTTGVKELITSILKDEDFDLNLYPNLLSSAVNCTIPSGRIISFHSPIDLHIYDSNGNHVGPNSDGDIEYDIPNIQYDVIDGNKFAYLPDGENYTIKGVSTGAGTFNVRIENVVNENVVGTEYFSSIPLTSTTLAYVETDTISLDRNGDGVVDDLIFSDDVDISELLVMLKDKIQALDIGDKQKKNILKKIDSFEKKIEKKNKDKSLERVKQGIRAAINRLLNMENNHRLTEEDIQEMVNILEQIGSRL